MPQTERIITTITYPRMHQAVIMRSSNSSNNRTEITSKTLREVARMGRPMEVNTNKIKHKKPRQREYETTIITSDTIRTPVETTTSQEAQNRTYGDSGYWGKVRTGHKSRHYLRRHELPTDNIHRATM